MSAGIDNRYLSFVGQRFGKLTLLGISKVRGDNNRVLGDFVCDCGESVRFSIGRTVKGSKTNCRACADYGSHRTHGMRCSPEYSSWGAMKARCLNMASKDYPRYGAAGISICPEWITSFESFYSHIGPRPDGTTLDRIDGNAGYIPGNVRWATAEEQARNRPTSFEWRVKGLLFQSAIEAGNHFGVSDMTIRRWVNGHVDKRRGPRFHPPLEGCYVIPRY